MRHHANGACYSPNVIVSFWGIIDGELPVIVHLDIQLARIMNVLVRRIEEPEYVEASDLVLKVFREMVAASMAAEGIEVFEAFASAEQIRLRDKAGAATFIAKDGDRLMGVLQVREEGHITLFFTLPTLQGQGIGRALICAADHHRVSRTVNSSTIAVKAYESFGFRACGQEQVQHGIRFIPMARNAG